MKRLIILLFVLLMTKTGLAFAHTGLASSTASENERVSQQLEEITLTFNDQIERISTFKLLKVGEEISLLELKVVDTQLKGLLENPLEAGFYEIDWKIVGLDGHPITGTIPFVVEMESGPAASENVYETGTSFNSAGSITVDSNEKKSNLSMFLLIIVGAILSGF